MLNNVPLAGQSLGVTRVPINQNFATIDAIFSIDHVPYNTVGAGKHNKVTFPLQAADPVVAATDFAIYSKANALGVPQLYMNYSGVGPYPWTDSLTNTNGWTRLPSGILLKWGQGNNANGLTNLVFPVGLNIPAFTSIFQILVCTSYNNVNDGDGFVRLNNFVAPWTSFNVYASHRTTVGAYGPLAFNYLAIGV
jgi:hypothetical protein